MYCSRMMARSIRVGLVIDCTALDIADFEPLPVSKSTEANKFDRRVRYFHNPSEWDDYDVEYCRLSPPKDDDTDKNNSNSSVNHEPLAPQVLSEFYKIVSNFLQKTQSNATSIPYIALFDSRGGLGAAAYLAAAYMCHSLKAPVHAAIEAVKEGAPAQSGDDADIKFGLCDVRLVKDLQTRFKGKKEIVMKNGTPSWWWAVEDDDEEDDDADNEKSDKEDGEAETISGRRKRKREEEPTVIPPCSAEDEDSKPASLKDNTLAIYPNLPMEALEPVEKDSQKWIRAISVLTQITTPPNSTALSPNSLSTLPIKAEVDISNESTDLLQLQYIKNNPEKYKVTWLSSRGRRGLLLILSEAVYFIEQSTTTSPISISISISIVTNIKFPSPKDLSKVQHRTLLDVILVNDVEKNKSTFRFYALDILCIEGGMVFHKPFDQRYRYLNEGVLIPRKKDEALPKHQQQKTHHYGSEQIKIRAKEYFPMMKLGFVMKDVCSGVGHEAEGVRVVPVVGEYGIGSCSSAKTEAVESSVAVVWNRGGSVDDEKLKSLLLA